MGLLQNPSITEQELSKIHHESSQWAIFCANFDPDLAKDILQQSYLKIVEGKAVFKKESSLKTWMFSLIRLTSFESQRKSKSHIEESLNSTDGLYEEGETEDSNLPYLYTVEQVSKALDKLGLLQREIIYLVFYCDYPLSEIAKILDVGIGTTKSEYHRAKVRLKLILSSTQDKEVNYEEKYC